LGVWGRGRGGGCVGQSTGGGGGVERRMGGISDKQNPTKKSTPEGVVVFWEKKGGVGLGKWVWASVGFAKKKGIVGFFGGWDYCRVGHGVWGQVLKLWCGMKGLLIQLQEEIKTHVGKGTAKKTRRQKGGANTH